MNEEGEMIKARLEVLETVVSVLAKRDPGVLQAVQLALQREYDAALKQASTTNETGFSAVVRTDFAPPRNVLAEQPRVKAYDEMRLKVGDPP